MKRKPDQAHRRTDRELAALEKRIAAEYKKADFKGWMMERNVTPDELRGLFFRNHRRSIRKNYGCLQSNSAKHYRSKKNFGKMTKLR